MPSLAPFPELELRDGDVILNEVVEAINARNSRVTHDADRLVLRPLQKSGPFSIAVFIGTNPATARQIFLLTWHCERDPAAAWQTRNITFCWDDEVTEWACGSQEAMPLQSTESGAPLHIIRGVCKKLRTYPSLCESTVV